MGQHPAGSRVARFGISEAGGQREGADGILASDLESQRRVQGGTVSGAPAALESRIEGPVGGLVEPEQGIGAAPVGGEQGLQQRSGLFESPPVRPERKRHPPGGAGSKRNRGAHPSGDPFGMAPEPIGAVDGG